MFEEDWIMRQINTIVQFAARIIFHKDAVEYHVENPEFLTDTDGLYLKIENLLHEGKICEAEDLLYENRSSTREFMEVALDFYQKLAKMSDAELEEHNFSRQEVYDGLKEIVFSYKGMPPLPFDL